MPTLYANGIRHFYRREGDRRRPALLLAHPIGFDHGLWDRCVPPLLERFQVIRYDLRGHGGTEASFAPYSVALLAQDAGALLDALGIDDFDFAGTSLGGLVGLQLALTRPQGMRSLLVANASARLPLPAEEWDRRIALAASAGTEAFVAGIAERMFSPAFRASDDAQLHTLIETFRAMDGKAYGAALAALRDADLREQLADIRVRTVVVAGELDSAVPRANSESMAAGIAGARLAVLPGGHLSAVESSAAFAAELLQTA